MTTPEDWQAMADRLAAAARAEGRPNAWFEELYAAADRGEATTPWNRDAPYPPLAEWVAVNGVDGTGRAAAVVGCGLGADAEFVATLGYATVAFDLAPSAVDAARARHPDSPVTYLVADLLDLPAEWIGGFDLVVDVFTVQAMPPELHAQAAREVSRLVAPGGRLIAIGMVAEGDLPAGDGPPYPLTEAEIDGFRLPGMREDSRDRVSVGGVPRWRLVLLADEG